MSGSDITTPISQIRELKASLPKVTWLVSGGARCPSASPMSALSLDSVSPDFAAGLDRIPPTAIIWAGLGCPLCSVGLVGSAPQPLFLCRSPGSCQILQGARTLEEQAGGREGGQEARNQG